ncbi:MAG: hypothetical protein IJ785_05720 [Bacteroidales bacterium]|nr:hypothetical protein [Bacteroidales bacterium]
MKKVFVLLFAVVALSFAGNAQHAIGVRGAFGNSTAAELSYQQALGSANRLELDLGWHNYTEHGTYFNLTGIYQWNWNISGGLGWYVGLGANAGLYTGKYQDDNFGIGLDGQIGIEYKFSIPLQVSLDFRPQMDFLGHASGFGLGIALSLRYCF